MASNKSKRILLKSISVIAAIIISIGALSFSLNKKDASLDQDASPSIYDYPVSLQGVNIITKPTRIVVLAPFLCDIVHTLGYDNSVIGRSQECSDTWIPNAVPVGLEAAPDVEKIKSLQPELILIEKPLSEDALDALQSFDIKVLTFPRAKDFSQFGTLYTNVGATLGGASMGYKRAASCANSIYLSVMEINKLIPKEGEYFTACYLYDGMGHVATGDTLSNDLMQVSGAYDIASNASGCFMDINEVIAADPTYIFCKPGMTTRLKQDPKFSNMRAVKQSRIYEMDPKLIEAQDNRMIDAVTFMASAMYPDLV